MPSCPNAPTSDSLGPLRANLTWRVGGKQFLCHLPGKLLGQRLVTISLNLSPLQPFGNRTLDLYQCDHPVATIFPSLPCSQIEPSNGRKMSGNYTYNMELTTFKKETDYPQHRSPLGCDRDVMLTDSLSQPRGQEQHSKTWKSN